MTALASQLSCSWRRQSVCQAGRVPVTSRASEGRNLERSRKLAAPPECPCRVHKVPGQGDLVHGGLEDLQP